MVTFAQSGPGELVLLTTKEVADLLRVKERKVYDLASAGEIPHRRVTGKLLFPKAEIMAWIDGNGTATAAARPAVITGSHDPLLDWALRESGAGLAQMINGSGDGLGLFERGDAAVAGIHVPDASGWNIGTVSAMGLSDCVLVGWAERSRGLILSPQILGNVRTVADIAGRRVVLRQAGAGAAALFDMLIDEAGLSPQDLDPVTLPARTESDAAAAIACGEADVALGIEAMARQFRLGFVPLLSERFDLLIDRRSYFTAPVQALLGFARTEAFRDRARALGGYDLAGCGQVRWLSP
ncbi:putative molybdopterin biosynthesis protein MoeA/LysR substrate binding-domain-containing protein [Marinibacterium anthonyi]|nr:putative molybdopterin biosynthesis protein MoeA/LysR substrate binding-domain-containing protein [Marinibacterium anthonyi]